MLAIFFVRKIADIWRRVSPYPLLLFLQEQILGRAAVWVTPKELSKRLVGKSQRDCPQTRHGSTGAVECVNNS